jgi:hypothetical protein
MTSAHRFPFFNGEFDRFISAQLKNWAVLYHAPEDGYANLLQRICSIFVCNRDECPDRKNPIGALDNEPD